jgi:thioesterase domain-containing protein
MAGHSAGGLIVFEAARMLLESGNPEPRVMLMDAPRPYNAFGYRLGELVLHWREMIRNPSSKLRKAAAMLFQVTTLGGIHQQVTSQADDLVTLSERHARSVGAAIKYWKTPAYNGGITVMRTRQGRMMALGRPYLGWASVTRGALKIIDVPGGHINMLEPPHLQDVVERLINWLSGR